MGCSSSKREKHPARAPNGVESNHVGQKKRSLDMTQFEAVGEARSVLMGGSSVRFAHISKRGYYPDDPDKANQDALSVTLDFGNANNDALLGVYDGHGRYGDKCAQFVKTVLPDLLSKHIDQEHARQGRLGNGGELTKAQLQSACMKAHIQCNRALHRVQSIDDSLSGTTSISVCFQKSPQPRITVCNVGDSRAVIGQKRNENEPIRAFPLSKDQTPYRKDERKRVKMCGARVLSLDQIEGYEPVVDDDDEGEDDIELGEEIDEWGDPPRIWSPDGEYPGTAFSRSIGDNIAEGLGVIAEPEMITRDLTETDKIIVIASDGVFEFLTNQSVIDICAKFHDPLEACRAVVAEAYELWLQYELRTDDITIICIFIDNYNHDHLVPLVPSENDVEDVLNAASTIAEGVKPLRSSLSRQAKNVVNEMKARSSRILAIDEDEMNDEEDSEEKFDTIIEKTPQDLMSIQEAVKASIFFRNITDEQKELVYRYMEPVVVHKGDWIIKQYDVGDKFYIVDTGNFEVRIANPNESFPADGGKIVHCYVGSKNSHPSFGELALMHSTPRAASVIARSDGKLWALKRRAFRKILDRNSDRTGFMRTLMRVKALKCLSPEEVERLSNRATELIFKEGTIIVDQNSVADIFYYVIHGKVEITPNSGQEKIVAQENGFFGEEMMWGKPYDFTAVASGTIKCFQLSLSALNETVGNLQKRNCK